MTPSARSCSPLLFAVTLGVGCGGDVQSDFTLRLLPRAPENQFPFAGSPAVKIVLRHADGGVEFHLLGEASTGTLVDQGVEPLVGSTVGLLVETAGGPDDGHDPGRLVAYGEVGPFDLSLGGEAVEQRVLLPTFGAVGDLDALSTPLFHGDAVLTTAGDVLLVGGARGLRTDTTGSSDRLLRLRDLDEGDWRFTALGALPWSGSGQRAALVKAGDQELALVTGGRDNYGSTANNRPNAALIDPLTGEVLWHASGADAMKVARSDHQVLVLQNGKVLIAGGMIGQSLPWPSRAPFELFDPSSRSFTSGDAGLDAGSVGLALASLGSGGALACGGSALQGSTDAVPSAGCSRITLQGTSSPAAPLPRPAQYLAMAPLPDGRVLACGGTADTVRFSEPGGAAESLAWIYDPEADRWDSTGDMVRARALHRAIPTPDGRVLIVGGAQRAGLMFNIQGEPADCAEVFDPSTGTFSQLGPCTPTGSGAAPVAAWHAAHGAFVLSGVDDLDHGGESYGIIGFGPRLPR